MTEIRREIIDRELDIIEQNIEILEKTNNAFMTSENTLRHFVDNARNDMRFGVVPEGIAEMAQNVIHQLSRLARLGHADESGTSL